MEIKNTLTEDCILTVERIENILSEKNIENTIEPGIIEMLENIKAYVEFNSCVTHKQLQVVKNIYDNVFYTEQQENVFYYGF